VKRILIILTLLVISLQITPASGYQDDYWDVEESFFHINGVPMFRVVVGAYAAPEDYEAAIWITQSILKEIFNDKEYLITYNQYILVDNNISTDIKKDHNLILIGGPVANTIVKELVQLSYTSFEKWDLSLGDIAYIKNIYGIDRHVLIVAGKDREATQEIAWNYSSNIEDYYIAQSTNPETTAPPPTITPVPTWSPESYYEFEIGKSYGLGRYTIICNTSGNGYADFAFIDDIGQPHDIMLRYEDDYFYENCRPKPDYPDYCEWVMDNVPNEVQLDGLHFRLGERITKHISPIENPVFVTAYVSYNG